MEQLLSEYALRVLNPTPTGKFIRPLMCFDKLAQSYTFVAIASGGNFLFSREHGRIISIEVNQLLGNGESLSMVCLQDGNRVLKACSLRCQPQHRVSEFPGEVI